MLGNYPPAIGYLLLLATKDMSINQERSVINHEHHAGL
jgi:hypothetical protein